MSSSNWRDGEIRELLTIMGEKVMQSHLTKTLKDGAIYEKDAEERSLRAKPRPDRLGSVLRPLRDRSVLCTETFYNATKYLKNIKLFKSLNAQII